MSSLGEFSQFLVQPLIIGFETQKPFCPTLVYSNTGIAASVSLKPEG
jgi:hypothetical protein